MNARLYIVATVWLLQRGSPESKKPDRAGTESDREQRMGNHAREDSPRWAGIDGARQALFSRSLGLAMAGLFLLSWLAQSIAGAAAYNEQQLRPLQAPSVGVATSCPPTSGAAACRAGSPNSS